MPPTLGVIAGLDGTAAVQSPRHLPVAQRIHAGLRNPMARVLAALRMTNWKVSKRFNDIPERRMHFVITELERWWQAAKLTFADLNTMGSVKTEISGTELDGNRRSDFEGIAALQRDEYELFYKRLVWAFNHDDDDENDLNPDEVLYALEVDWENDSRSSGFSHIDKSDFEDCVFELADTWVKDEDGDGDIDKDDYLKYLKDLYPRVFETDNQTIMDWWQQFVYARASEDTKEKVQEKQKKQDMQENTGSGKKAAIRSSGGIEMSTERAALKIQKRHRGNMTRVGLMAQRIARWIGLRSAVQHRGHWRRARLRVLALSSVKLNVTTLPTIVPDGSDSLLKLVQYTERVEDLSILYTGLKQTRLTSTFETEEPMTFFAPSDAAFAKLPPLLREYLFSQSGLKALSNILLFHAHTQTQIQSADVQDHENIETMEGEVIKGGAVSAALNQSRIDIKFDNGLLHQVDEVFIPHSMAHDLEQKLELLLESNNATMLKKLQLKEWADKVVLQTKLRRHSFASVVHEAATFIQRIHRGAIARRILTGQGKQGSHVWRSGNGDNNGSYEYVSDGPNDKNMHKQDSHVWRSGGGNKNGSYDYVSDGPNDTNIHKQDSHVWRSGGAGMYQMVADSYDYVSDGPNDTNVHKQDSRGRTGAAWSSSSHVGGGTGEEEHGFRSGGRYADEEGRGEERGKKGALAFNSKMDRWRGNNNGSGTDAYEYESDPYDNRRGGGGAGFDGGAMRFGKETGGNNDRGGSSDGNRSGVGGGRRLREHVADSELSTMSSGKRGKSRQPRKRKPAETAAKGDRSSQMKPRQADKGKQAGTAAKGDGSSHIRSQKNAKTAEDESDFDFAVEEMATGDASAAPEPGRMSESEGTKHNNTFDEEDRTNQNHRHQSTQHSSTDNVNTHSLDDEKRTQPLHDSQQESDAGLPSLRPADRSVTQQVKSTSHQHMIAASAPPPHTRAQYTTHREYTSTQSRAPGRFSQSTKLPKLPPAHAPPVSIIDQRNKGSQRQWMAQSLTPHRPASTAARRKFKPTLQESSDTRYSDRQSQSARGSYKYVSHADRGPMSARIGNSEGGQGQHEANRYDLFSDGEGDLYDLRFSCCQRTIYGRAFPCHN